MSDPTSPADSAASPAPRRHYVWILLALALVLAVWGIVSRLAARNSLEHDAASAAIPSVTTLHAVRGPASSSIVLPGSVQAYYEARSEEHTSELQSRRDLVCRL